MATVKNDRHWEVMRRFDAIIAGAGLSDLRGMLAELPKLAARQGARHRPVRPELRRAPLDEVCTLTIRVDLHVAKPPIWYRRSMRRSRISEEFAGVLKPMS